MTADEYAPVISSPGPATPLGRIAGAGYIRRKTGYLPWRVLGQYALVYVLAGRGRYQDVHGPAVEVAAGDMLLLFPELAHRYGPGRAGAWDELHVIFEGRMFEAWREAGLLDPRRPVYRLLPVEEWQRRILQIAPAAGPDSPGGGAVGVSRLLTVLTEAEATRHGGGPPAPALPWLERARTLLETDLSRAMPMREAAARLGLSYETFRKAFGQQVGVSPARYRAARRLEAARALLRHTALTGRQIADSLGFPDEFSFSRRFKQAFGVSPREFRRRQEASQPLYSRHSASN
jgi:AraC-like DNA-binding protein